MCVGMIEYLNHIFENKGIEVRSVIITNVKLPPDIADPLEEKTTYASKNSLERKKQSYELRILNDEQEISLMRQKKIEEQEAERSKAKQSLAEVEREHEFIKAQTNKELAEIEQEMQSEINKIKAESQLEAQTIINETKIIK